jgi:hypothetical protein
VKRRRVLAAILGLPAAVLLAAGKCEEGGGGSKKVGPYVNKPKKGEEGVEPPPVEAGEDWPVNGVVFREMQISAWFSPDAWPYVIEVIATDHTDNREIRLGKHHVEQGQFVCPVTWEASHDISLVISWHCAKRPDRGGVSTRSRNARGYQEINRVDAIHRQDFTWNMSPRRR